MSEYVKSFSNFKKEVLKLAKEQNVPLAEDGFEGTSKNSFETWVYFAVGNKLHKCKMGKSLTYLRLDELQIIIDFYKSLIGM